MEMEELRGEGGINNRHVLPTYSAGERQKLVIATLLIVLAEIHCASNLNSMS